MPKQVNFNSVLTTLVGIMLAVIGFFCQHSLKAIEESQSNTRSDMKEIRAEAIPRPEFTIAVESIKRDYLRLSSEQVETRAKLVQVELEVAKHFKGP